jgi:hypothetical protein
VIYLANQETKDVLELYSAPLDGSTNDVKLNGALVEGGYVDDFTLSSDGRRVIYLAAQQVKDSLELYAADMPSAPGSASNGDVYLPLVQR